VTTPLLDVIFGTFRPVRKPLRITSRETRI
jgi:hypothetical protein